MERAWDVSARGIAPFTFTDQLAPVRSLLARETTINEWGTATKTLPRCSPKQTFDHLRWQLIADHNEQPNRIYNIIRRFLHELVGIDIHWIEIIER